MLKKKRLEDSLVLKNNLAPETEEQDHVSEQTVDNNNDTGDSSSYSMNEEGEKLIEPAVVQAPAE